MHTPTREQRKVAAVERMRVALARVLADPSSVDARLEAKAARAEYKAATRRRSFVDHINDKLAEINARGKSLEPTE